MSAELKGKRNYTAGVYEVFIHETPTTDATLREKIKPALYHHHRSIKYRNVNQQKAINLWEQEQYSDGKATNQNNHTLTVIQVTLHYCLIMYMIW
jgi:hypothetical protein